MVPYGARDLGQPWLRLWLVALCHQAITWTNVDLSLVVFCATHLRPIPPEILNEISVRKFFSKLIKSLPYISWANELTD